MINLFFNNKGSDIEVEATIECEDKNKADRAADNAYNDQIIKNIEDDLFHKYGIRENEYIYAIHDASVRYRFLVKHMCEDIAKTCGLLRDILDDK